VTDGLRQVSARGAILSRVEAAALAGAAVWFAGVVALIVVTS
jgi:hypothetical protein